METDGHDKDESTTNLQKQQLKPEDDDQEPQIDKGQAQAQAQAQAPSQTRSYECTFCKRGFSNAQALGGHMNIHRKHKAKLKLSPTSSSHEQQLQQISPPKALYSPNTPTSWPWNVGHDQDQSSDHQKEPSGSEQLDLELRLGPEPTKDLLPTKGTTRKFF